MPSPLLGAGPDLPVASVPTHSRGGSLVDGALSAAALNGSAYGGSEGSSKIGGPGGSGGVDAAPSSGAWQQRPSSAAVLGAGGSAHEVHLDIEMAGRASSAPVMDESAAPPSPVKQAAAAAQQAWSALSGLPRRMAGGPAHRRTESQEPVLLQEDKSGTSVGS